MISCIFSKNDGRSLEPLTCSMPVSLLPICGKPVAEFTVDMLRRSGFFKIVIFVQHKKEAVEEYFSSHQHSNFEITYNTENIPENETVILINADTFYSFNLENAVKFHKNHKADITVITKSVNDLKNNRSVFIGTDRKILSFHDNPDYTDCISSVDTGIYVMSAKLFRIFENADEINDRLLNHIISENFDVYAYETIGHFRCIKTAYDYIKCQGDILCHTVNSDANGHRTLDGSIICGHYDIKKANAVHPLCIGNNVKADIGTVIDGLSYIGNNVNIGRNAYIHNCVIMDGAFIGDRVSCSGAVICRNAVILNSAEISEGCIIGENAIVGENTSVKRNMGVWNDKNTGNNKNICYPLRYGHSSDITIDENGINGETNAVITPHTALSAGMSFGGRNRKIVIGYSGDTSAYTMAQAVLCGLASTGTDVYNMGECLICENDFAVKTLNADGGMYILSDSITKIIPCLKNAMPLNSKYENMIENSINHHDFCHVSYNEFGKAENAEIYKSIYLNKLKNIIPDELGFEVSVNTSNPRIAEISRKIFSGVSMKKDNLTSVIFHLSSDSRKISAYSEISGFIFHEKLIMLCCQDLLSKGNDLKIPYGITCKIEEIALEYGRTVFRYSENDDSISEQSDMLPPDFINDGFMLMANVLKIISERGISLSDAVSQLPSYANSSKFISIDCPPADIIKKLCGNSYLPADGTVINSKKGRVSIKPSRSGKSMMIYAESSKYEFAKELCDFVEKNINDNTVI